MPTWLVKCHSDIFAPVVTDICNASFQQVKFPQCCKTAIIRPRLKKRTLDPNDLGSYRPISNLGFLSKVVEKVVDARLAEHVNRHRLLPVVQSSYRPFHSTETAILRVLNDMIGVVDQGHIGALMLLGLIRRLRHRRPLNLHGGPKVTVRRRRQRSGLAGRVYYVAHYVWPYHETVRMSVCLSVCLSRVISRKRSQIEP